MINYSFFHFQKVERRATYTENVINPSGHKDIHEGNNCSSTRGKKSMTDSVFTCQDQYYVYGLLSQVCCRSYARKINYPYRNRYKNQKHMQCVYSWTTLTARTAGLSVSHLNYNGNHKRAFVWVSALSSEWERERESTQNFILWIHNKDNMKENRMKRVNKGPKAE